MTRKLLSKSKYINGLQCQKYLWLLFNDKEKVSQPDAATQHTFDQGYRIGELAKRLFPDGIDISPEDFIENLNKTKEEIGKFANTTLMFSLLPVLDDLERAFTSIPPHLSQLSWVDGIRLIERKLQASLEAQKLSQIKALGEPFDPNLHEAVMYGNGKEGIVIEELQKGYKLHDRIIRPTMVVVGQEEEEGEKKEE